jgi:hypothetical protein
MHRLGLCYAAVYSELCVAWETDKRPLVKEIADRAYHYLIRNFEDAEYGECTGRSPQQVSHYRRRSRYGQAFAIYGLSEYAGLQACLNL